jgi:hypothetical protein
MMPYILHVSILLAVCLLFYKLLLQKETFFQLNRYILLAGLIFSFSLPLLQVPQEWSLQKTDHTVTSTPPFANIPLTDPLVNSNKPPEEKALTPPPKQNYFDTEHLANAVIWLYWFGVIAFGINFLVQLISLLYKAYTLPVIKDGCFRIVELTGDQAPCSFGTAIFINPEKYDWDTYNQILLHEKMHIRQGHSFDLLLAELVIVFQWFNPLAWLYRKELENNLEFFTDEQLIEKAQVDKKAYQVSLLKVTAPHFPLSLTTNYNQSLLKKRLIMMNARKSNIHIVWKYLFLFPVLLFFVCLLNEPKSYSRPYVNTKEYTTSDDDMGTTGSWFATIKGDKVHFQFKDDKDDNSNSGTTFNLSEFKDLPKDKQGTFSLTREAGTMEFTGKFEGAQGMGQYVFKANKAYSDDMKKEGVDLRNDQDVMVFFMVNVTRSYVQMLKKNGYKSFDRKDLIPLAALNIDEDYILSFKRNGFNNISLQDLIPLKSLGVDEAYINEIKAAGYPNVSADQLITFKAQGIDGKYIADIRKSTGSSSNTNSNQNKSSNQSKGGNQHKNSNTNDGNNDNDNDDATSPDNIVAIKALDVNPAYIQSLKEVGYGNLSSSDLISMKSLGVTADYIKGLQSQGFKDLSPSDIISMKSQDITGDYAKGFAKVGYTNIDANELITLKALNITPEYIKSFQDAGYKDISIEDVITLKSQNITPQLIQEYKSLGFDNVSINDVVSAKATGTTPAYIKSMKAKGHNLKSIDKYMQLKVLLD